MKTVLVSVCIFLLVKASFGMYWVYPEKKVGQYSEIKNQNSCENEYKKYCLNGGECYYLIDEDILGCNCTWRKTLWKIYVVDLGETLGEDLFSQKLARFKIFNSKSDML